MTIAELSKGEKGIIETVETDRVPLKLIEMGCLPGNQVELLQIAPLNDPLYLNVNGSYLAIRRETAAQVTIRKVLLQ